MASCLLACHQSGTWSEDPGNFRRAWGVEPPAGVFVVHSWYTRSPHFTREEIYYFELRADASYARAFAEENHMTPTRSGPTLELPFMEPRPSWFAPKPLAGYEIWRAAPDGPPALVLWDAGTGSVFIHVAQL